MKLKILIQGEAGAGKTTMAILVANALIAEGFADVTVSGEEAVAPPGRYVGPVDVDRHEACVRALGVKMRAGALQVNIVTQNVAHEPTRNQP